MVEEPIVEDCGVDVAVVGFVLRADLAVAVVAVEATPPILLLESWFGAAALGRAVAAAAALGLDLLSFFLLFIMVDIL